MAAESDPHPRRDAQQPSKPLDRDERVKLDLPFGTALRALLKTPPPETKKSDAPKGS